MTFRRIRNSNDSYTWLVLALLSCLWGSAAVAGSSLIPSDEQRVKTGFFLVLLLLALPITWCALAIVRPRQWEIVVEGAVIRWGRTARPARQRSLQINQIRRIIHDRDSKRIFADVGGWSLLSIGHMVLLSFRDQLAMLAFLAQEFPHLKIEVRESFE